MLRNFIWGALALSALVAFTTSADAQRLRIGVGGGYGGGGYYGGGYGGRGYSSGYGNYGGRGYSSGYGNYGGYRSYNPGVSLGIGIGIGAGSRYGGYGYSPNYSGYSAYNYSPIYSGYRGYGYTPNYSGYSNYAYAPSSSGYSNYAVPATTYIDPGYPSITAASADSGRQSLYYAPDQVDNAARLRVLVPAGATVWVGGVETNQSGMEREFNSPALTPGKAYSYEVKARWMAAGEPVEQTRKVKVMANQTTTVDFGKVPEVDD